MSRALRLFVAALALYLLYFHDLGAVGLLGPDEPRYASVGREMFLSGDWLTPVLWGEPWFEKPPLEYWGIGAAFAVGVPDDIAPRAFNAVLGAAFLILFGWLLAKEFSATTAWMATAILGTSAAWIAESRVAVMDLPLAAFFSSAMLLAIAGRFIPAAVCLALAVLAKGLVPLVLALPYLWFLRKRWRELALPAILFLAIVQPWFLFMTIHHGQPFLEEFFLTHHFSRFTTAELQHVQPFWFFLLVLPLALFPWTPLLGLLRWPADRKRQLLFIWFAWTLVFFSISRNKLPGYILPAIPPLAVLMALRLAESRRSWAWCAACGAMLSFTAALPDLLPAALASGLSRAGFEMPVFSMVMIGLGGLAVGAWQQWRGVAATTCLIVPLLMFRLYPALDDLVSTRSFWLAIEPRRGLVCVDSLHRAWRYGLNFYAIEPLPDCADEPKPVRIRQRGSERPQLQMGHRTEFPGPTANKGPGVF